jgi:hypothetical protein
LSRRLPQEIASLCLFPGLPGKFASVFDRNYWRYSDYFCPWGFALQKEDWSDFELALRAETIDDFHRSSFYGNLSRRRKKTWDYRIQKIQSHSTHTYDTQIQVIASSKEKKHLSPLFRSSRNNGFGDGYATNTKSHRPWWFLGGESSLGFGSFYIKNRLTCEILSFWDSLTVGGDRKFPNKAKLLFYWFNSRKSSQRFN